MSSAPSRRRPSPASTIAVVALALLSFPGGARAASDGDAIRTETTPRAGHIVWAQVAVRAKPDPKAPRTAV